jgi:hypothetical protein
MGKLLEKPIVRSKTVLFGATGRHNFGDLLMPHIIQRLMPERECVVADLLERDMTQYGGHKIESIASLFDSDETINVIINGGEVGGCTLTQSAQMLSVSESEVSAWGHHDLELGYILPKSLFRNPGVFVANSIGGISPQAREYLADYDYVRESLGDYIAVQVSEAVLKVSGRDIREQLESLMSEMGLPVVLFCAGIAPGHDSLEAYVGELPGMAWYFDDFNIWSICNVVANAKIFVGTSLHARIVASAYGVPRTSIGDCRKVLAFEDEWDTGDHDPLCRAYMNAFNEWSALLDDN